MTINPRDYDLDELRKMARERGDGPRQSGGDGGDARTPPTSDGDDGARPEGNGWGSLEPETDARDRFQDGLYRELLPLEAGADDLTKPYLDALPESYGAEYVVFEWLEFLLTNFGYQGTSEAIQFYESVGWLTENVAADLNDYLLGLESPAEEPRGGTADDHRLSLVYVARLVSMQ
ncbi:FlaD/FlaE family flagellar protein [Halorientalis halophila]|uniref:FlaD/FlaE family flagellar protein n=1 Tax=Halorientalis halophila TaxID=3108499 RepID=UPI00300B8EBC